MLPQIENLYFYSVNLYFYMVKKDTVWGNYDFFIWSKRVLTRSKISVLLGQMDFYMVSKNENNNSGSISPQQMYRPALSRSTQGFVQIILTVRNSV